MSELNSEQYNFAELLEEREWRKCAPPLGAGPDALLGGFLYFCENYWYIRHPDRGRIKFDLFSAQIETVHSWINNRYSLILKARQIGFSTLVAAYAFWNAQFYDDRPILMLSRTEREAIKLLQKAKYGRQFLPEWMRFRAGPMNETQTRVEFAHGSYIESLPSASDPARGESAWLIVVDEFAFLPNPDDAWGAIEPVADVGGRVILLSTANGEGNLFHQLWVEATTGNNRFAPLFFPWSANGRDEAWYLKKLEDTPDWLMAQEYPDNPEEAFLKSGRPIFDLDVLRAIEPSAPIARGYIATNGQFIEDGGALAIWAYPEPEQRYVIGADASQGLEHSDFASVHVIHARTHEVVAHWHGHIDPDLFGTEIIYRLGNFYNKALVGVESNTHGLTTLIMLRRLAYFPIYYERSPKYKNSVPTDVLGFRTTQTSKPLIIDELQKALRESMVLHDEYTLAELRTFVRNEKGKMQGSPYDDRTMSLAIANYMLRFVFMNEFMPEHEAPPGSLAWWEKQTYGESFSELTQPGRRRHTNTHTPIGGFAIRTRT